MAKPNYTRERAAGRAYQTKWSRFIEAGFHAVVIGKQAHPEAWERWESYFRLNDLALQLSLMQERAKMTVPCLDPLDFIDPKAEVITRS